MIQTPRSQRHLILPGGFIRAQISERLPIGTSAAAQIRRYSSTLADFVVGGEEIEVVDANYLFEGWAGDIVVAHWQTDSEQWEIVAPTQRRVRFELTATLNKLSSAAAKVRYYNGSAWVTHATETLTVWDADDTFSGVSGDEGRAEWSYDSQRWEAYQKRC